MKIEAVDSSPQPGLEGIEYEPDEDLPIGQNPDVKTEPVDDDYVRYEHFPSAPETKKEAEVKTEPVDDDVVWYEDFASAPETKKRRRS